MSRREKSKSVAVSPVKDDNYYLKIARNLILALANNLKFSQKLQEREQMTKITYRTLLFEALNREKENTHTLATHDQWKEISDQRRPNLSTVMVTLNTFLNTSWSGIDNLQGQIEDIKHDINLRETELKKVVNALNDYREAQRKAQEEARKKAEQRRKQKRSSGTPKATSRRNLSSLPQSTPRRRPMHKTVNLENTSTTRENKHQSTTTSCDSLSSFTNSSTQTQTMLDSGTSSMSVDVFDSRENVSSPAQRKELKKASSFNVLPYKPSMVQELPDRRPRSASVGNASSTAREESPQIGSRNNLLFTSPTKTMSERSAVENTSFGVEAGHKETSDATENNASMPGCHEHEQKRPNPSENSCTQIENSGSTPAPDSSPGLGPRIQKLESYVKERKELRTRQGGAEYFSFIMGIFKPPHRSATIKISAAEKLIRLCQEKNVEVFSESELGALDDGRLSKLYKELQKSDTFRERFRSLTTQDKASAEGAPATQRPSTTS